MFKRTVVHDERRVARIAIEGARGTLRTPGDVRILDVGVYGLAIEAPAALEVGRRYCLELRHGRHTANVEVTVRWACPARAGNDDVDRAGVEFTEIWRDGDGGIWNWLMVPGDAGPEPQH